MIMTNNHNATPGFAVKAKPGVLFCEIRILSDMQLIYSLGFYAENQSKIIVAK